MGSKKIPPVNSDLVIFFAVDKITFKRQSFSPLVFFTAHEMHIFCIICLE